MTTTTHLHKHQTYTSSTLTTNPSCQLDILGHNSDTLSMDSTQVGVLEESNKVCLGSLLQSKHSMALET
ncbi:hypothetical protein CR513_38531 [Mucuna pruriens]|uniref:Uncharacterized protein n=1 Tax=Mucuna pruriens TaxID=157652 RepID=A0A371FRD1_MUCPR|nr:hypothetical protein CR513_38531 [Mucuna pruriens]